MLVRDSPWGVDFWPFSLFLMSPVTSTQLPTYIQAVVAKPLHLLPSVHNIYFYKLSAKYCNKDNTRRLGINNVQHSENQYAHIL